MDDLEEPTGHVVVDVIRKPFIEIESKLHMVFMADGKRFNHFAENASPEQKIAFDLMSEVLNNPTAIFFGLNRKNFEEGTYCYAGSGEKCPKNFVFLIPVKEKADGLFILDWCFRPEDPRNKGIPINWRSAFEELIWPSK